MAPQVEDPTCPGQECDKPCSYKCAIDEEKSKVYDPTHSTAEIFGLEFPDKYQCEKIPVPVDEPTGTTYDLVFPTSPAEVNSNLATAY